MLTKRKIKKLCEKYLGIFLKNPETDIEVMKYAGRYWVKVVNLRAPQHIIKSAWERHTEDTEFEDVEITFI
jgi:hypothetical protein